MYWKGGTRAARWPAAPASRCGPGRCCCRRSPSRAGCRRLPRHGPFGIGWLQARAVSRPHRAGQPHARAAVLEPARQRGAVRGGVAGGAVGARGQPGGAVRRRVRRARAARAGVLARPRPARLLPLAARFLGAEPPLRLFAYAQRAACADAASCPMRRWCSTSRRSSPARSAAPRPRGGGLGGGGGRGSPGEVMRIPRRGLARSAHSLRWRKSQAGAPS